MDSMVVEGRSRGQRLGSLLPRLTGSRAAFVLLAPAVLYLGLLFVIPLARVIWQSVSEPTLTLDNFRTLFLDGYTLRVLVRTMLVASVVSALTTILGYPYAYAMTLVKPRTRALLITLVLVPFWTSMMARNFAWVVILERNGPLDSIFTSFGVEGMVLIRTAAGVAIAMTQVLLPFVVLPMYARMDQIDRRLVDAAKGLGATKWSAFRRVYLPMSMPGVAAGATLVFVVALGFYVTPALIGAPQHALIAQLIRIRVGQLLDFGTAGALGVFLLVVTVGALALSRSVFGATVSPRGALRVKTEDGA